jgi:hypothetical protein
MTRIGLITTGRCEHRALGPSLRRVFGAPGLQLEPSEDGPVYSLTSSHVRYPPPSSDEPTNADELVASMMAMLDARNGPDFVFAVDDLELPNVATPHHVTRLVSHAVTRYFQRRDRGAPTHRELERIATRCSFHLLCPMLEAYFFGETAALERAGATRPAILDPMRHLEQLRSVDGEFLAPLDVPRHPWRRPERAAHPKAYLSFLVDPADQELVTYRETVGGCRALATLDWAQVFRHTPPEIAFAHALFEDLADAIGAPNPFPGTSHPLTRRRVGGVLRNLE